MLLLASLLQSAWLQCHVLSTCCDPPSRHFFCGRCSCLVW